MSLPGLRGMEHVGLTVPDLEAAVRFFEEVLGGRRIIEGLTLDASRPGTAAMLDVDPRARARLTFLRCGHGTNIELFRYEAPDQATRPPRNSDVGGHHLAFYVDDMTAAVADLRERGIEVMGEPELVTEGPSAGTTWVYFPGTLGPPARADQLPAGQGLRAGRRATPVAPRAPGALTAVRGEAADAAIVGAGLAGAVMALRLAQAGLRVVCLEQGGRTDPADYPGDKPTFEVQAEGPWHPSPNVRRRAADYPVVGDGAEMRPLMFCGVGGSTVLFGAHWMRLLPSDFRVRSLDGVADDWPLSYADLRALLRPGRRGLRRLGPRRRPGLPRAARLPDAAAADQPVGRAGRGRARPAGLALVAGAQRDPVPTLPRPPALRAARHLRLRLRRGGERVGRPHPLARPNGSACGSSLARASPGSSSTAPAGPTAWSGSTEAGNAHRQRAAVVILAASAVGTPRLLLMSARAGHPDGLANRSGLVGRRLMMHPFSRVVGLFDEPMRSWQGHWGQSLHSMEFAETDERRGFVRGAKWNLTPAGGPLAGALFPWPGERRWGSAFHEHVRAWLGHAVVWGVSCEDLPEPANRVTLDPEVRDGSGLPAPRVTYRIAENARRMLAFNLERAAKSFDAAGAVRTLTVPLMPDLGWHPLGTCRMGADPGASVVDPDGACHDVPNLWVVDGSVFVTGSSVNPAATIAALALRSAERLLARRHELAVAA